MLKPSFDYFLYSFHKQSITKIFRTTIIFFKFYILNKHAQLYIRIEL